MYITLIFYYLKELEKCIAKNKLSFLNTIPRHVFQNANVFKFRMSLL